jgi:hypothetical protein
MSLAGTHFSQFIGGLLFLNAHIGRLYIAPVSDPGPSIVIPAEAGIQSFYFSIEHWVLDIGHSSVFRQLYFIIGHSIVDIEYLLMFSPFPADWTLNI